MSKKYAKAKGREAKKRFVQLEHYLIKCPAYKALSSNAVALYIEFKYRYNGANNGYIHMSVREAAEVLGCAINTARNAIKDLEDKGFIICRFKGKFDFKVKNASEFILTEYSYNDKTPSKDFMRWSENEF